ncbi:MAG: arsenical pump-driving ATPase [Finegoldia sp.]|nr:arsenical pump-driving ATPase [Finegoldia sp.]
MESKYEKFNLENLKLTKYLFFTGKGGVGKTSISCAIATKLADMGKNVMLVSTDPASNLQDVFETELDNKGVKIPYVPNLTVANFEPEQSAAEYRESVVGPFRGKLPDVAIENMEEQLSGSCTVEIASFNEFSNFITDKDNYDTYDHIIFDTAPTGHALRMLELPSAWSDFIEKSKHGASCLGQLAGLKEKQEVYKMAVDTLANGEKTTLVLVARAEEAILREAARASVELEDIGMDRQILIINGVLEDYDDDLSKIMYDNQREAIENIPDFLKKFDIYTVPLKSTNIASIEDLRRFFDDEEVSDVESNEEVKQTSKLRDVVEDLYKSDKKIIFTMGKGGVGKTTIAAAIAKELAKMGKKVHLTTTDPAAHIGNVIDESFGISMSNIDEKEVLAEYREEVLKKAYETNASQDDIDYIEEDLRSPCTQEIAVFRAFAQIVDSCEDEVIVIDTAPTGHTLLLLESTENYDREIARTQGETPESIKKLLPKLKDETITEVLIVALAEATPYYEAKRLKEDLDRAGIFSKWWVINESYQGIETSNKLLANKAKGQVKWINKIVEESDNHTALVKWTPIKLQGQNLEEILD